MQNKTTVALACAALALAGVAFVQGWWDRVLTGFDHTLHLLWSVVLLIPLAFVLAGLAQVLIPQESIKRWMGEGSGWKGFVIAGIMGALIPGGPYVYYPIAVSLLHAGADIGSIVTFVVAKNIWSVTRLPLEFAFLGTSITLTRYLITLVFPIVAGLIAQLLFRGATQKVREALPDESSEGSDGL